MRRRLPAEVFVAGEREENEGGRGREKREREREREERNSKRERTKIRLGDYIRAPPRRGRYWEIHPLRPRLEISRKPEGNLNVRGDGFPNTS